MKKLVTIEKFADMYGKPYNWAFQYYSQHKEIGTTIDGKPYVDIDKIKRFGKRKKEALNYAHELYWLLMDIFETERDLSKRLAVYGHRTVDAWNQYIGKSMWVFHQDEIYYKMSKALMEFILFGSRLIWIYTREKQNETNQHQWK